MGTRQTGRTPRDNPSAILAAYFFAPIINRNAIATTKKIATPDTVTRVARAYLATELRSPRKILPLTTVAPAPTRQQFRTAEKRSRGDTQVLGLECGMSYCNPHGHSFAMVSTVFKPRDPTANSSHNR
jgi:hypothetical protein